MLKLQKAMSDAGVLDAVKLSERISATATFAQQAQWMIAEMMAGRIVNGKTRERIGDRTIDFYSRSGRDIDLHSSLATMLDEWQPVIRSRK